MRKRTHTHTCWSAAVSVCTIETPHPASRPPPPIPISAGERTAAAPCTLPPLQRPIRTQILQPLLWIQIHPGVIEGNYYNKPRAAADNGDEVCAAFTRRDRILNGGEKLTKLSNGQELLFLECQPGLGNKKKYIFIYSEREINGGGKRRLWQQEM